MADQPEIEVRFAVVMYGGVSLAIYINGVTQELLSLVRATARSRENEGADYHILNVTGVEAVYRRLGEHLKSRFVVDILSGTSAGGINAVYLAKALANDQQINRLKDLWIDEGDIGLLVNDQESAKGLGSLSMQGIPASLLNSQRMYYKLLYALQGMKDENVSSSTGGSPYIEELDLFITATDLQGLKLKIPLFGSDPVDEYRYRNVFHFHYSTPDASGGSSNDFEEEHDPFLAFAARCTSSFPFAFEPMRLKDVKEVLSQRQFREYVYKPEVWNRFYRDYEPNNFPALSFGDGGYLDNKPFSYATATLHRRRADLPVDRKLVYIEPAPEHIHETLGEEPEPPDAFANVMAALFTLPRYETIREDLQTVTARNNLIRNMIQIVQNIEGIYTLNDDISLDGWMSLPNWREKFLDETIKVYGHSYPAYHQLRVEEVLENLSAMLVRAMGWEEESPQGRNLSALLQAWRRTYYKTSSKEIDDDVKRKSENDILFRLDTRWRMRRLYYVRGLIDVLLKDLGTGKFAGAGARAISMLRHSKTEWPVDESNVEDYRSALLWVKKKLNQAYSDLRGKGRELRSRNLAGRTIASDGDQKEYATSLAELRTFFESKGRDGLTPTQIEELTRLAAARADYLPLTPEENKYYQDALKRLEDLTLVLARRQKEPKNKGLIREALSKTAHQTQMALNPPRNSDEARNLPAGAKAALEHVRKCLTYYHDRFEYFDMLTFPISYGTEVGESDEVEVIRISPEDADSLVKKEDSHTKLAGTKLGNFGAFFNRQWRENDVLWGRLDGAECLIKAVLPGERDAPKRDEFIRDAQQAILEEFLIPKDEVTAFQARYGLSAVSAQTLEQAVTRITGDKTRLIENFKTGYRVDPNFPPEDTLKVIARGTRVLSQLMGGVADKYPFLSSPAGILSRFGQIFFGIVQIALPQSILGLLFRNLIGWVYMLELILIVGARMFNNTEINRLGIDLLVITVVLHAAILILRNVITKRWKTRRMLQSIAIIIGVVLTPPAAILIYAGLIHLGVLPTPDGLIGGLLNLLEGIFEA